MTTILDLCIIDIDIDDLDPVGTPAWFGWITRVPCLDQGYYHPLSLVGHEARPDACSKREILQRLCGTAQSLGFTFAGVRDHSVGELADKITFVVEFDDDGVKRWVL
jgi:hypothetical protein